MAKANIKYLHAIGGYLHYRRRVPTDLKSVVGKNEWLHALGLAVGQEHHAVRLIAEYNAAYASFIARERITQMTGEPVVVVQPGVAVAPVAPESAPKAEPVKISAAYAYDREMHGGQRDEKAFMTAIDSFVKLMGDRDTLTLTPKDVQTWINKCEASGQKTSTIGRRIAALRAVVNRYFREHEIEKQNPFTKPKLKESGGSGSDRLPFHKKHIQHIDHYCKHAPRLTDDMRHMVALLKLTGARPLEIGGLDADDLMLDHDVPHIWFRHNAHRRLKTKGSERRIPLVGKALEAAQEAKQKKPKGALFPTPCHNTNSLSQRLNKMLRRAGVPKSPRLVVYSFRHTLEEALRAAGVREHTQKRIMGHTDNSVTGRYGAPAGMLEELQQAIRVAEPLLGKVDESIYSEAELGTKNI
ncbi:MAG: tyrosine-type recombinase/integrase [Pseudomonadota bacterium]